MIEDPSGGRLASLSDGELGIVTGFAALVDRPRRKQFLLEVTAELANLDHYCDGDRGPAVVAVCQRALIAAGSPSEARRGPSEAA